MAPISRLARVAACGILLALPCVLSGRAGGDEGNGAAPDTAACRVYREVVYRGVHHLKAEDLARITGLRKGEPVNVRVNQRACRAIEAYYHKLGRLYASAELAEGGRPGDTRVVIDVCEGPVVKPDVVEFDGNRFVSAKRLALKAKSSALCQASPRPKFAPDVADADARALADYYRDFGFGDVQVSWDLAWGDDAKQVRLVFHIREGQRYPCGRKQRPPTGPVDIHVGRIETPAGRGNPMKP